MSLLNWEKSYSVGVKEFDDQHKRMFNLINNLYDSMSKKVADKDEVGVLLEELSDYGKKHLATEEKRFDQYNYPKKDSHKVIHDSYRDKIQEFIQKKDETLLSFEIIDYLEDWWLGHITSVDKEYTSFFNELDIN